MATRGYDYDPRVPQNSIGFYPLYPMLLKGVAAVVPGVSILTVGVFLSLLFLLAALYFIADLAAAWGSRESGLPTVALLLLFPAAFFLAAVYTESLFLLSTAAALWGARRDRWGIAAAGGAAAGLTRLNGAFILLPLVWLAVESAGWRLRGVPRRVWLALGVAAAGAAAYPAYLWARYHDPLLYVHEKTTAYWSPRPGPPWAAAANIARETAGRLALPGLWPKLSVATELVCLVGFLSLSVVLVRRGLAAEGVYVGGTLLFLFSSGTLPGLPRYVVVFFPAFFALARVLRNQPVLAFAYAFGCAGVGSIYLHRYVHMIFVA